MDDNIGAVEERYRVLKRLGVAGTSHILIAKDRRNTVDVVIKVFNGVCVPREVEILQKLSHPTIVSAYDSFPSATTGTYNLVMRMLGRREMDLFEYIEEHGPLSESVIVTIFAQLVSASIYLHHSSIAHCDIKDENVIIDPETLKVQLIDFGSARPKPDPVALEDITISYAPPVVYTGGTLIAGDLDRWCLGVLLFTMMYSRSPFSSSYEAQACIVKIDRTRHSGCTPILFNYHITPYIYNRASRDCRILTTTHQYQ